jgi:hypothetical protein
VLGLKAAPGTGTPKLHDKIQRLVFAPLLGMSIVCWVCCDWARQTCKIARKVRTNWESQHPCKIVCAENLPKYLCTTWTKFDARSQIADLLQTCGGPRSCHIWLKTWPHVCSPICPASGRVWTMPASPARILEFRPRDRLSTNPCIVCQHFPMAYSW